jgi:hypothetical protein
LVKSNIFGKKASSNGLIFQLNNKSFGLGNKKQLQLLHGTRNTLLLIDTNITKVIKALAY